MCHVREFATLNRAYKFVYAAVSWYAMGLPRTEHAGRVSQGRCRNGLLKYILGCTTITSALTSLSSSMMRAHGMSQAHTTTTDRCRLLSTSTTCDLEIKRGSPQVSCGGSKPVKGLTVLLPPQFRQQPIDRPASSLSIFIFASGELQSEITQETENY